MYKRQVHARGASKAYRVGKFLQRNRTISLSLATVFLALSVALISVSQSARKIRQEADRAEAARSFLFDMVAKSDPFTSGGEKTLSEAVDEAIDSIDSQFIQQPDIEAELRYTIGSALSSQGKYASAREQLGLALHYFQVHGPAQKEALTLTALGRALWSEGDFEAARIELESALDLVADDPSPANQITAVEIMGDLAGLLPNLERNDEAIALVKQALAKIDQGVVIDPLNQAVLFNNLAVAFDYKQQYAESIGAYEQSIFYHRKISAAHPDLAIALSNVAQTYELVGDMDAALVKAEEAYQMIVEILGADHPETSLLQHNLGSLMINAGDFESAVPHLIGAVRSAEIAYGAEHLYTGRFSFKAAFALHKLGQIDAANHYALRAGEIYAINDDTPESWITALQELNEALTP